jgi:xanthine/CO dehydrogenase XdhC/CoxF family maturation factor
MRNSRSFSRTVVETFGSTYRKAGARMLITHDGEFHGIIGGGCFEGDLLERARRVFIDGKPNLVFYDMRAQQDELWDWDWDVTAPFDCCSNAWMPRTNSIPWRRWKDA